MTVVKRRLNTVGQPWVTLATTLMTCWQSGAVAWSQTAETGVSTIERGKNIIERRCSQCHAIGIDDASRHPAAIAFRELSARYPVELLREALAEGILTGHPDMPVFGFYPNEIDQMIAYIESIQNK